jgi:hypothetical protein
MISGNYFGGLEDADTVKLTDVTITDVYQAETDSEICVGFTVVNEHSSPLEVSIYRYDTNTGTDVLYWRKTVPANDVITDNETPRKLRKNWKIKAKVSQINVVSITPTVFLVSTNEAYNR